MNYKIKHIVFVILISTVNVFAQTVELDLNKSRAMALENSENIQIAEQNIKKAKGELTAARSAWLPNLNASATGMCREESFKEELTLPTKTFDPMQGKLVPNYATHPLTGEILTDPQGTPIFNTYAFMPIDLTTRGGFIADVSAEQALFAGGRIIAGNKMAKIGTKMADLNKNLQSSDLIYETDKAYYQYLSVKEKVKLAKEYLELLEELKRLVNDAYETGLKNKNDLLKVQVKYNEASLQVQKAESALKLVKMVLCRQIGLDLHTDIVINDSINHSQLKDLSEISPDTKQRTEYQLLQSQAEMAKENIKLVRGEYLPSAGVAVSYNYMLLELKDQDNYDSKGLRIMGNIKVPITSFGERKGKTSVAKANYQIKMLELKQTEELLQLETEQAILNYNDTKVQVELSEDAIKQAEENMRISQDNYDVGLETLANLLEAKTEWQKVYSNKIDALTLLKVAESNYLRVSNKLNID
jgi:outer membrane protein TolC